MLRALLAATFLTLPTCASHRVDGPQPLGSVEYRRDGKLMMVQARVNGAGPYWFVVDSGASRTVIDPSLAVELKLASTGSGTITGAGQGAIPLAYTHPVTIELGGGSYQSSPYVIDLSKVPISKQVRGLIGSELFLDHIVRVDPATQRISWFDPAKAPALQKGSTLPLRHVDGKLYLTARIEPREGVAINRELRIDTGSESSINDPSAAKAKLIASTTLGNGLGANFEGISGKYRSVTIGPYVFRNVWGPGGDPPLIGMELLQRFVMTFDAPHGRLHLAPLGRIDAPVPHAPGIVRDNPS
jgi:hypothetical protein